MVKEIAMKQSDIGLIPEDWEVYKVLDLIELLTDFDANGSFSSVAENVTSYNYLEFAWYVRSTDLENNTDLFNVKYVDKKSYNFLKKTSLYGDELLFLKRGDIGNVYLFKMRTERATLAPNLYLLKLNNVSSSKYLYQYFISDNGQKQLRSKNAGSTLGALYKDDVKSILVPLPPLPEQEAIAEALGDCDAWIDGIEQLLAKKRLIKQGAMQELLSPKEDWEVKKLGEVCEIDPENLSSNTNPDFQFNYISLENVEEGKLLGYSEQKFYTSPSRARRILRNGDILIATVRPNLLSHLLFKSGRLDFVCSTGFSVLRTNQNSGFIFYHFFSSIVNNQINNLITGSNYPAISSRNVKDLEIPFPCLSEQTRIASILSDMDAELEALGQKLEKARQIKKGMMQELLTGRVRLL